MLMIPAPPNPCSTRAATKVGIDHDSSDAIAWAQAEISLSNMFQTGWAWWGWNDPADWGVEKGNGPPDTAWLDVLAQPFVRAAPGRLTDLSYNPDTKMLSADDASPALNRTLLISWPASAGTPDLLSSCAEVELPYQPSRGLLQLRLLSPACQVRIRG